MAMDARYRMSQQRLEELKKELAYMQDVEEKKISEQIAEARSFGDLSENSEYDEAKNAQGKLYSKMAEYKDLIENVIITDGEKSDSGATVAMGSKVVVREKDEEDTEEYEIVGSQEANPMQGRISEESPLGRALMGHKAGDTVSFEAPAGVMTFVIVSIE